MDAYKLDQSFHFTFTTRRADTGAATDADSLPTFSVYEELNDTAVGSGNCAKRDDANTTGYYYASAQITAAAGYEVGKTYEVKANATVNTVADSQVIGRFRVMPDNVYDAIYAGTDNLTVDLAVNAIGTNQIADGAITNAKVADDVDVNVKTISANAITATAIQADAVTKIVTGVWSALLTGLTTVGSIGEKLRLWVLGADNRVEVSGTLNKLDQLPTAAAIQSGLATSADITATRQDIAGVADGIQDIELALGETATEADISLVRNDLAFIQADVDSLQQNTATEAAATANKIAILEAIAPILSQTNKLVFDATNRVLAAASLAITPEDIADIASQVAQAVGDPLANLVPGAYEPGTAGFALGIYGNGARLKPYYCPDAATGGVLQGVRIACFRDEEMTDQHGSTQVGGVTYWLLDPNRTYYMFCEKDGYTFDTNPDPVRFTE